MVSQRYRDLVERPTETISGKVTRVKPKKYFGYRSIVEREKRNSFYPWCIPAKRRYATKRDRKLLTILFWLAAPFFAVLSVIGDLSPLVGGK